MRKSVHVSVDEVFLTVKSEWEIMVVGPTGARVLKNDYYFIFNILP